MSAPQDDNDYYEDELSQEEQDALEDEMNYSMEPSGHCGQAGSEYCEFDCPYRRDRA